MDISKLSNSAPTINMNTPDLQYIQPQQVPQYAFDASPVQMSMGVSQPVIDASNAAAYEYAGVTPTFTPDVPVVSAEVQAQQQPQPQPEAEQQPVEEAAPSAKRVEVTKKVRQVPVSEKVKIMVRHGR